MPYEAKVLLFHFSRKKCAHLLKGILPLRALLKRGCKDGLAIPATLLTSSKKNPAKKPEKFCGESKSNYLYTPLATKQAKQLRKCFIHEDTKWDFEVDFQWKTARIRKTLQKVH